MARNGNATRFEFCMYKQLSEWNVYNILWNGHGKLEIARAKEKETERWKLRPILSASKLIHQSFWNAN